MSTDRSQMTNTLIPFWDMANHDNGELSTDFDDDKDCTLCMAHKDFEIGESKFWLRFLQLDANV